MYCCARAGLAHFRCQQLLRIGVWLGLYVFRICIQMCITENNLVDLNICNTSLISHTCLLCILYNHMLLHHVCIQKCLETFLFYITISQAITFFSNCVSLSASKTLILIPALLQVETLASFPDPSFPLLLPPSFKETPTPRRKVAVERSV